MVYRKPVRIFQYRMNKCVEVYDSDNSLQLKNRLIKLKIHVGIL